MSGRNTPGFHTAHRKTHLSPPDSIFVGKKWRNIETRANDCHMERHCGHNLHEYSEKRNHQIQPKGTRKAGAHNYSLQIKCFRSFIREHMPNRSSNVYNTDLSLNRNIRL